MNFLGLLYIISKTLDRFKRSDLMRSRGLALHYTNDIEVITKNYTTHLKNSLKL